MSKKSVFVLISALSLTIAAAASAGDTYPGAMCEAYSGSVVVDSNGHIQNNSSTTWAYVICPIIGPYNNISSDPKVFVTDRNAGSNVWCRSVAKNTGTTWYGSYEYSSGDSSSYQDLEPEAPTATASFTWRYYQCGIPPVDSGASEIRGYRY